MLPVQKFSIMPKAFQENLPQSSNGSWWERGGVREHWRKSGPAGLSYIFNNILLERKMRRLFVFLQKFLPLWLPPSCSVGCWFGCRTWPLYHQLTLVQICFWWSIQFWLCLFFSRWYSGSHTCFSSTLLLAGQSFVHWGLATPCVKLIFSFFRFCKGSTQVVQGF